MAGAMYVLYCLMVGAVALPTTTDVTTTDSDVTSRLSDSVVDDVFVPNPNQSFLESVRETLSYLRVGSQAFLEHLDHSGITEHNFSPDASYTALVPSDFAWVEWHPIDYGFNPFSVSKFLERTLLNHFLPENIHHDDILANTSRNVVTLGGNTIRFYKDVQDHLYANGVLIKLGDTPLPKGNILFLDQVLFINDSIVEDLRQQNLDKETGPLIGPWFDAQFLSHVARRLETYPRMAKLRNYLTTTKLEPHLLSRDENDTLLYYTLFAPTSTAFASWTSAEGIDPFDLDDSLRQDILLGLFVPMYLYKDQLVQGFEVQTVNNKTLRFDKDLQGNVLINGEARILSDDDFVYNLGNVFVIDKVLHVQEDRIKRILEEWKDVTLPPTTAKTTSKVAHEFSVSEERQQAATKFGRFILSSLQSNEELSRMRLYIGLTDVTDLLALNTDKPTGPKFKWTMFAPTNKAIVDNLPRNVADPFVMNSAFRTAALRDFFVPEDLNLNPLHGINITAYTINGNALKIIRVGDDITVNGIPVDRRVYDSPLGKIYILRDILLFREIPYTSLNKTNASPEQSSITGEGPEPKSDSIIYPENQDHLSPETIEPVPNNHLEEGMSSLVDMAKSVKSFIVTTLQEEQDTFGFTPSKYFSMTNMEKLLSQSSDKSQEWTFFVPPGSAFVQRTVQDGSDPWYIDDKFRFESLSDLIVENKIDLTNDPLDLNITTLGGNSLYIVRKGGKAQVNGITIRDEHWESPHARLFVTNDLIIFRKIPVYGAPPYFETGEKEETIMFPGGQEGK